MRRFVTFVFLLFIMGAASRGLASAAEPLSSDSGALVSVALFGGKTPAYVLCPAAARSRADCTQGGGASEARAIDGLRAGVARTGARHVVLFLTGFRTNFAAGRIAAQRVQDVLGGRFLLVHVDWGSHGSATGYRADGSEARKQTPAFAALVVALHAAVPNAEIDVFAHSMGTRLVAGAMATVAAPVDGKPIVDQTVLAAPDLALRDYQHAILRQPESFGHVTVYASRHDKALFLSSVIHLHKRLGQLAIWHMATADTVVVDASAADPTNEGHGYAIHDEAVIRDVGEVFLDAPVPHAAWTHTAQGGDAWTLVPADVGSL